MNKFKIRVPASTSNLGPGFDVIGAALKMYNDIEVCVGRSNGKGRPDFEILGEGAASLPRDRSNIVWKAIAKVLDLKRKRLDPGTLAIKLVNRIPLASGLGSSAAARLGGILAGFRLAGVRPAADEVIELGMKLEGHPDNIVPALLGGMCVCADTSDGLKCLKIHVPDARAVVCHPEFELATDKARSIVPRTLPIESAVFNLSRLALFIAAGYSKDYKSFRYGMEDKIHQPARAHLVPGMNKVIAAALRAGAYGASLSGAGPSLIALAKPSKAGKVSSAMIRKWKQFGIRSECFVLDFEKSPVKI